MDFPEVSEPREKAVATGPDEDIWRLIAYYAGLFGAFFYGPALFGLVVWMGMSCEGQFSLSVRGVLLGVSVAVPLAPFAIALARAGWDVFTRVVVAALPGLVVGVVAFVPIYFILGWLMHATAGVLGLVLGLLALGPCSWRGDAQGRALALLGIAPAFSVLAYWATDRDLSQYPRVAAAWDVVSRLFRWEYLLALVAFGLGIGALRLFRVRRRRTGRSKPLQRNRDDLDAASPEVSGDGILLNLRNDGPKPRKIR